jgi:hypothetical protein
MKPVRAPVFAPLVFAPLVFAPLVFAPLVFALLVFATMAACNEGPVYYFPSDTGGGGGDDTSSDVDGTDAFDASTDDADVDDVGADDADTGRTDTDSDALDTGERDTRDPRDADATDVRDDASECEGEMPLVCDDRCVDTASNPNHCGGCDIACDPGEACLNGTCACPCSAGACREGACFVLRPGVVAQSAVLGLVSDPQRADIVINLDTTGSLGGEIGNLKSSLASVIVPEARELFSEVAFGLTTFEDFPCGDFGSTGDLPFELKQRVTTSSTAIDTAISGVSLGNGGDYSESGVESLYQIATGEGGTDCVTTPAFNPSVGYVAGVADGTIGGVGFREGALPIVLHITDATSHSGDSPTYYGATRREATGALRDIGAELVGIATSLDARSDLRPLVEEVGSTVLPCAWGSAGTRPEVCAVGECCTGLSGDGVAPVEGVCPMVFASSETGTGLDSTVVRAIEVLARSQESTVRVVTVPDPNAMADLGVDTSCVVKSIALDSVLDPTPDCGASPGMIDTNGDSVDDAVTNVSGGTTLGLMVSLRNDCVDAAGVFSFALELQTENGTRKGRRVVQFYVPEP